MKIFIVDDEAPARERLKELLGDIAQQVPSSVVGEARNGLEAIEQLPQSGAQVLLLDIQMPGMGGLEVARHLAALEEPPRIVFVTAHDRHAVEAFELNALDYLMKPVRAERLAAALRKASVPESEKLAKAAGAAREYLSVAERNRISLVPVRDILFLRAEQKYVTVRTRSREHLVEEPHWLVVLDGIDERLPVSRRQWPMLRDLVA
ncbi:MAG: LytR/AlgR family response regulator transcription factor [Burkholderiales bacterium]